MIFNYLDFPCVQKGKYKVKLQYLLIKIWVPPLLQYRYVLQRGQRRIASPQTLCMITEMGRVWSAQYDRGKAAQRSVELSQMPALPLNLVTVVSIAPASGLIALSENWKRCSRSSMSSSRPNEECDQLAVSLTCLYGSKACLRLCYTQVKFPRRVLRKHPKHLSQGT